MCRVSMAKQKSPLPVGRGLCYHGMDAYQHLRRASASCPTGIGSWPLIRARSTIIITRTRKLMPNNIRFVVDKRVLNVNILKLGVIILRWKSFVKSCWRGKSTRTAFLKDGLPINQSGHFMRFFAVNPRKNARWPAHAPATAQRRQKCVG